MSYKLSNKAEQDLRKIYQYTQLNFGNIQADSYLTSLEESIMEIANTPTLAHKVDGIRTNYKRYLHQHHAIYFTQKKNFIYIVRVLHQQMKVSLHLE